MPSGKTHDRITYLLAPPVLGSTYYMGAPWPDAMALTAAFLFSGLMFSGDLDLYSKQYKRWGLFRWIWKPYQWLVPHRSALSHGIFWGTLVRLLYVTAVFGLLAWGALSVLHAQGQAPTPEIAMQAAAQGIPKGAEAQAYALYALGGLWLGGASHTLTDAVVSAWKRRFRKGSAKRRR